MYLEPTDTTAATGGRCIIVSIIIVAVVLLVVFAETVLIVGIDVEHLLRSILLVGAAGCGRPICVAVRIAPRVRPQHTAQHRAGHILRAVITVVVIIGRAPRAQQLPVSTLPICARIVWHWPHRKARRQGRIGQFGRGACACREGKSGEVAGRRGEGGRGEGKSKHAWLFGYHLVVDKQWA
jgi:hypothetical protein